MAKRTTEAMARRREEEISVWEEETATEDERKRPPHGASHWDLDFTYRAMGSPILDSSSANQLPSSHSPVVLRPR